MSDLIFSIKTPKKKAAGIKLKSHLSWPIFNPKNPIKKLEYNQIDINRKAEDFSLPFGRLKTVTYTEIVNITNQTHSPLV
tara:strand:- start:204 stop:443 length:240 start_codon:yes stop_codon:yes gene_type:complete